MDNYGYFGKGTEGYIHYTQAVKRSSGGGNGGGGCGTTIISVLVLIVIMALIGSCFPS